MAARKPEVVIIPLAYNLETRFQNGIRGLRPWRARSDDRRTSPTIGSSRNQYGGTKPEVVIILLPYNLETRFQNGIRVYAHGEHVLMIIAHRRQSDHLEINMAARKPEVVITSLTYNIETRFQI